MPIAFKMSEFQTWLNDQLRLLNTDENVFGAYIIGILEGEEETQDEKFEALLGILSGTGTANTEEMVASILQKWLQSHPSADEPPKKGLEIDVNAQLAKLLDQQKLQPAIKEREYTEEELRIKQQILAQYSQSIVSEAENDDSDSEFPEPSGSGVMAPNTNKSDVANLAKEKREQARVESAAKKQKDREDREKQKQMREEKKEKRKTVKGERRR